MERKQGKGKNERTVGQGKGKREVDRIWTGSREGEQLERKLGERAFGEKAERGSIWMGSTEAGSSWQGGEVRGERNVFGVTLHYAVPVVDGPG